ncbi:acyltransferase family protein [Mucilaginibacter sp. BJC16-A38]|uniref:acyltransferase family protein n=1 Tax=Mucilaginibacter phenanthrenivorans TaxID=1234842 RepID=UPI002157992C|nr:acyltransferase family protein [Mucilaginibacter phenanthrenivorans]MCR8558886.1 acyltransferase family protein [Mucilaginibacter phenanthrenivorans]
MNQDQTLKNINSGNAGRQYYLDWLRVITICLVFLFHCSRFFDFDDWHVKNAVLSSTANLFTFFMVQWMMPLFFFISGASTWFALQSKTGGKFLKDRMQRILVPLIFGIFILSPHQVYFERVSHYQFAGTFLGFLPHYFSGLYAFGGNFAWMGLHLWYLLLLFVFSVISLPLLLLIKRISAGRIKSGSAFIYLFMFVILLALPGCLFSPDSIIGARVWGGWNIIEHLVLFILGYFAFSMIDIQNIWLRYRYLLLVITVLSTAVNIYLFVNNIKFDFGTFPYFLKIALRSVVCFSWICTLLGFAKNKLNYTNKFLKYGNEAVLPFYIIHQPVIVLIGYFIVQLQLSIGLKYVIIVVVSLSIAMFCYEFLIRRSEAIRYLFGIGRSKKK